jgi:hypothetical protein
MKFPKSVFFFALLSPVLLSPVYAQRGGGHGGGHAGGPVRGGFSGGGFRGGVAGSGFRGGYYGGRYYGPSVYFGVGGWTYPYYGYYGYGPYYYYGYDPNYYGYDPYAYGGYPAYSAPPVTIQQNNGYPYPPEGQGQPVPPYPQQTQPQQPQVQPQSSSGNNQAQNFYLIAFTDHTIQAATAYKVEGDQIHWITREGQERQAALSSVDVRFSPQMNRDRGVDFRIP